MTLTTNKIHDSIFKESLRYPKVSQNLLKKCLDTKDIQIINWSTIKLANDSFVKNDLSQEHCDIVYEGKILNTKSRIYLLLEHRTTAERMLPYRMQEYNADITKHHLKKKHKLLPIIISICIYGGKGPYPYSIDIYDCFEEPELARQLMPHFKLKLIDLSQIEDRELLKYGQADMLLILLKQGHKKESLVWIQKNPKLIYKLLQRPYAAIGISYLLAIDEKNNSDDIIKALLETNPNKNKTIMNAAEQLIDRGRQQGIQQGVLNGKTEVAKYMLFKLSLDINTIQLATGLSIQELKKLTAGRC